MLEFLQNTFSIPPIFVVLSYALGTAVFIGIAQWSMRIAQGFYEGEYAWNLIYSWMCRALIAVILFSFSIQIGWWSAYIGTPENANYVAELVIMLSISLIYIGVKRRTNYWYDVFASYFKEFVLIYYFLFLAMVIWVSTIFVFMFTQILELQLISLLPFLAGVLDPTRDAVMLVGTLWLFPFIYWYQKSKTLGPYQKPKHYKFHHLLWPIIVGLFLFILPLFIERAVTSEKLKEMTNRSPPLERI